MPEGCPCGLPQPCAACCGRFHGGGSAPTAELLMRSRYTAFALGDTAYLLRTWHPSTAPDTLVLDPTQRWTRLTVLGTTGGGLLDARGTVQFRADYERSGRPGSQSENSRFSRVGGAWVYVDAV